MSQYHITDERLNAFIDDQLMTDERMQILDALKHERDLSQDVCELQRNDEILKLAYKDTPEPVYNPYGAVTRSGSRQQAAIAASLLFFISIFTGWQLHKVSIPETTPRIQELSTLDVSQITDDKILMHISKMDTKQIDSTFSKAESILHNKNIQIEIVANAEGLDLLRDNSPYAERIHLLAQQHKNLSFKACGIAMQAAELKEGNEIHLLPEAQRIPAALDQILHRLKQGWLYIKA